MDLGFAGLIEKIEARFGRHITNLLLAALVFLVFAWVMETIISMWVSGAALWENGGNRAILGFGKLALVLIAMVGAAFVVCFTVFRYLRQRAKRQIRNDLRRVVDENTKEIHALRDENIGEIYAARDQAIDAIRAAQQED